MKRFSLIVSGSLVVLLCAHSVSFAKEIGEKLDLTPTFLIKQMYDNNVFRMQTEEDVRNLVGTRETSTPPKEDLITTQSLGLDANYPTGKHNFRLSGNQDFVRYDHYRFLNYENTTFKGNASLRLGDGFFVNPTYKYSKDIIPRRFNRTRVQNDYLKKFRYEVVGGYQASLWEISLFTSIDDYEYRLSSTWNRESKGLGATFTLMPSNKTKWYVTLKQSEIVFDDTGLTNDNKMKDALFGGLFIFAGKNRLDWNIGLRDKKFANTTTDGSGRTRDRDFTGFIGKLSWLHVVSSDTQCSLNLSRDTQTTYFQNTTYYTTKEIKAAISHQLTSKIKMTLSANRRWSNYKGRTTDIQIGTLWVPLNTIQYQRYTGIDFSVEYQLQDNIVLAATYAFQKREANNPNWNYQDHIIMAALVISWK